MGVGMFLSINELTQLLQESPRGILNLFTGISDISEGKQRVDSDISQV